ncbi:MAG: hypothetical protein RR879_03005 [Hydrogenoanaerobacterium sp.]
MKKVIAILLCFILLLSFSMAASASDGDPNIDGGGGGTESGTGTNKWIPGDDGVRVTIVRESDKYAVTSPVDFGNRNPRDINMYFGLHNKLYYQSNGLTVVTSSHPGIIPATPMPTVVSSGGGVNIAAVKKYFSDEGNLRGMCGQIDFDFEKLTESGNYVIMLEPLVYITYNGIRFCMTATEAALYNRMTSGDLRAKLGNITSQNLPLAMFLEKPDLGFPSWGGATSGIRSDSEIISSLGIGTVRFKGGACCNHRLDCPCITDPDNPNECECKKEHPNEPCGPDNPNCHCVPEDDPDNPAEGTKYYGYHTDTDVITTIEVKDTEGGKSGISPDDNAQIVFNIDGDTYSKPFVTPPLESTEVWVKWHTPSRAKRISISVTTSKGVVLTPTVIANVTELTEDTPPDPQPTDLHPNFKNPEISYSDDVYELKWGEWIPKWHENLVWESDLNYVDAGDHGYWEDNGEYVDHGWWVYTWKSYSASAENETKVTPAKEVPTAVDHGYGKYTMKSGYGVSINVIARVYTDDKFSNITGAQNVLATFPEFNYKSYNRVMVPWSGNNISYSKFDLAFNKYSFKGANSHYTPIWFPDGMQYAPKTQAIDIWTPAGMLKVSGSGSVGIDGDCYDDWNIRPVK